ncbi:hypothetical protein F5884DRAFT_792386 [Xylogone sp. PMI_703]|nr:hypothetical protein F5884DRAFT_792386 [Xylogone sp. PMI_703]
MSTSKPPEEVSQSLQDVEDSDSEVIDMFAEPADYRPATPLPTTTSYTLPSQNKTLTLRLVGHNPLWGHHLWNGGRLISSCIDSRPELVRGKTVLELGAGAGLPSLVSAVVGARKVVVSDYPDPDLVQNLVFNVEANEGVIYDLDSGGDKEKAKRIVVEGYCWGADVAPLLRHLDSSNKEDAGAKFDVLILADLLFNHSEHAKLVDTIKRTLAKRVDARAFVFFTPYRPWLFEKDVAFFQLAKDAGFSVEKILEEKMDKVMFENDPGDEELRRTVFGYEVKFSNIDNPDSRE